MNEILETIIKEIYLRVKEPFPVWLVYVNARKQNMKDKDIRKGLIFLKSRWKIDFDISTGKLKPVLSEGEEVMIQKNDIDVNVDELKIKQCIRIFQKRNGIYPTASEIAQIFLQVYGQTNIETITRTVRRLSEENKIERTSNHRYSYKSMEKGLRIFL